MSDPGRTRPEPETIDSDARVDVDAAAPAAPHSPTPNRRPHRDPEQIGHYRIIERVGEGGMGIVYKAEQREPVRRLVALKVIRIGMDTEEVVARFEAERQALALMNHANVARVFEAGVTETGRPFFAMEFVPGMPLNAYCRQNKLSTRQRLEMLIEVCGAVQHAHQKGIIHRDLKPSNILVTLTDAGPVPKVIDFGIAKATNQQLTQRTLFTQTGALIGTPEYMSPEQAQTSGLDVDTRTDVYSLGVILFELLTDTLPFDAAALRGAGLDGMARIIRESEPPRPSTRLTNLQSSPGLQAGTGAAAPGGAVLVPLSYQRADARTLRREIQGDLDWIVLKAMEKDRTRRYDSAAALAADIRRHLDHEPVLARPPSTAYRLSKFVRKHRTAVAAAGLVAAALVVGLAAATFGLLQAKEQSRRATVARNDAMEAKAAAERARDQAHEANAFLRDLFMSFGKAPGARARLDSAVARLDAGWLKDDVGTYVACRLSIAFFFLNDQKYDEAERQLQRATEVLGPLDPKKEASLVMAIEGARYEVALDRGDIAGAKAHLQGTVDALRLLHAGEEAVATQLRLMADLDAKIGDVAAARKLRLEALDLGIAARSRQVSSDPGSAQPYIARATLLARAGRFKEAAADWEQAARIDPSQHWNWYCLACARLYLNDEAGYRVACEEMQKRFAAEGPRREDPDRPG
jgi:serine/threonine protein kinase